MAIEVRQERLALVAIQAGRDEHVDLRGDHREGDEDGAEDGELHLGEEEFLRRGVDHLDRHVRADRQPVRPEQEIVDRPGEPEADEEGEEHRQQRPHQPPPELEQMLHQRRLARLDIVVRRHAAAPQASWSVWGFRSSAWSKRRACAAASAWSSSRPWVALSTAGAGGAAGAGGITGAGVVGLAGVSTFGSITGWSSEAVSARTALHRLLHLGHFGVAHGLVELTLELGGRAPELAGIAAERAHQPGQLLRPDHDDRDHDDDENLRPTDVEHVCRFRARMAGG